MKPIQLGQPSPIPPTCQRKSVKTLSPWGCVFDLSGETGSLLTVFHPQPAATPTIRGTWRMTTGAASAGLGALGGLAGGAAGDGLGGAGGAGGSAAVGGAGGRAGESAGGSAGR